MQLQILISMNQPIELIRDEFCQQKPERCVSPHAPIVLCDTMQGSDLARAHRIQTFSLRSTCCVGGSYTPRPDGMAGEKLRLEKFLQDTAVHIIRRRLAH